MHHLYHTETALAALVAVLGLGWLRTSIRFARYRDRFSPFDRDGDWRPGGRRRGF